ncbi:MAG: dihydrofolate reductase family protein [Caulobacteraceae bacterium]
MVGVGTVIADNPQLSVREVEGPCPVRVVIDPQFQDARLRADAGGRRGADPGDPVRLNGREARACSPS